jgi:hypothetical protein
VLLACIWGIALLTVSFDLRFFAFHVNEPVVILTGLGTILMAAGFNLTLYSRLNHITQNKVLLRAVLVSVAVAVAVGKIPVLVSETITTAAGERVYRKALDVDVVLTLEGFFLCGLYIYLFRQKFIQGQIPSRRTRSFYRLLIVAQTIVAVVDVAANVLLFMNYYLPTAAATPLRYALKVKIEFLVLNRLVLFTQRESSSALLAHFGSNEEHRSQHRPNRIGLLHPNPTKSDETGRSRFTESQNSKFALKHSGHHTLRNFRSLPDLSQYEVIDRPMFNSEESVDQWSATDIRYLGRFITMA